MHEKYQFINKLFYSKKIKKFHVINLLKKLISSKNK